MPYPELIALRDTRVRRLQKEAEELDRRQKEMQ